MSSDPKEVVDEEGTVDSAIKQRILNSREAINHNDNILFTERKVAEELHCTDQQAIEAWGHSVKRYVRDVEILLRDHSLDVEKDYYEGIELGEIIFYPPETDFPFSQYYNGPLTEKKFKMQYNIPKDATLPIPVSEEVMGLKMIIEMPTVVGKQWQLKIKHNPGSDQYKTYEEAKVVPKEIYERAVRETDHFLQQVGIGVDVSAGAFESEEPLV